MRRPRRLHTRLNLCSTRSSIGVEGENATVSGSFRGHFPGGAAEARTRRVPTTHASKSWAENRVAPIYGKRAVTCAEIIAKLIYKLAK